MPKKVFWEKWKWLVEGYLKELPLHFNFPSPNSVLLGRYKLQTIIFETSCDFDLSFLDLVHNTSSLTDEHLCDFISLYAIQLFCIHMLWTIISSDLDLGTLGLVHNMLSLPTYFKILLYMFELLRGPELGRTDGWMDRQTDGVITICPPSGHKNGNVIV